jgi:predicted DNA-binding transcriptional regulator AlpA
MMRKIDQKRPYPPDFVSAATLAYRLDLSDRTIYDYVRTGLPKPHRIGNAQRWLWQEVVDYSAAQNGLGPVGADANDEGDEYSQDIRKALRLAQKAANDTAA